MTAAEPRVQLAERDNVRQHVGQPSLQRASVAGLVGLVAMLACDDGHRRGSVESSADGKTYLAIVDDNGGKCGPMLVDGQVWPHAIGQPGLVEPGAHKISCGGEIQFNIPSGVVFRFDYWGP